MMAFQIIGTGLLIMFFTTVVQAVFMMAGATCSNGGWSDTVL